MPGRVDIEGLDRAPDAARQHARQCRIAAVDDDAPLAWHAAQQVVELRLDGGQVGEDIGVVEFEIVQDQRGREVMHELAALVEQGRVVFVRLDDERAAAQPRRHAKILWHATDQEARIAAGAFEYPGHHGAGRGLAMRSGNGHDVAPRQQVFADPGRTGGKRRAAVEHGFEERIAARHHIADDEAVRRQRQLLGAIALDQFDAGRAQLIAHRRIDRGIAAGDAMPGSLRKTRNAAHEGAADSQDVQVHGQFRFWLKRAILLVFGVRPGRRGR